MINTQFQIQYIEMYISHSQSDEVYSSENSGHQTIWKSFKYKLS